MPLLQKFGQQIRRVVTTAVLAVSEQYRSLSLLKERQLSILAVASVLDVMSATIFVPFLPSLAESLGATPFVIGLVFSAPAVVAAITTAPAGYVSDRVGRRALIWSGISLSALPVMAISFAWSPLVLIFLRSIDALLRSFVSPATTAYLGDSFAEEERASAFSVYQTTRIGGAAVGPVIGGALAELGGIRLPFLVLGACTLIGGLVVLVFLPPVEDRENNEKAGLPRIWPDISYETLGMFLTVPAIAWLLIAALGTFGEFALNPIFPLLLEETVNRGPTYVGTTYSALAVAMLIFMPVGGRLADSLGRVSVLIFTKFGWFLVMLGLAWATSPLLPPLLMFLGGVLSAFAAPASMALRYEIAPDDREATFSGITGSASSIGKASGPVFAGTIMGIWGVQTATVAAGLSWLVSIPLLLILIPETGRSEVD